MISDSNALQDIAGEYDSSSDDDSKIQSVDDHSMSSDSTIARNIKLLNST